MGQADRGEWGASNGRGSGQMTWAQNCSREVGARGLLIQFGCRLPQSAANSLTKGKAVQLRYCARTAAHVHAASVMREGTRPQTLLSQFS